MMVLFFFFFFKVKVCCCNTVFRLNYKPILKLYLVLYVMGSQPPICSILPGYRMGGFAEGYIFKNKQLFFFLNDLPCWCVLLLSGQKKGNGYKQTDTLTASYAFQAICVVKMNVCPLFP